MEAAPEAPDAQPEVNPVSERPDSSERARAATSEREKTSERPDAEPASLRFVATARVLAQAAKHQGLMAPAFRSPPRTVGVGRSMTRRRDDHVTVSVLLRGRPWAAVLADMVDGVVAANRLRGVQADRCRRTLWDALGDDAQLAA